MDDETNKTRLGETTYQDDVLMSKPRRYMKGRTMKRHFIFGMLTGVALSAGISYGIMHQPCEKQAFFDNYANHYTFDKKLEMRISEEEAIELFKDGKAVLVDVRFPDEHKELNVGFGFQIPLNELPKNLHKLPKDKIIITGCLGNERANIARMYLLSNGFEAKHLIKGIPGLNEKISNADRKGLNDKKTVMTK